MPQADRPRRPAVGRIVVAVLVVLCACRPQAAANELDRVVFGSLDGAASGFVTVGAKLAEKGTGPAMLASAGVGSERYASSTPTGSRITRHRTVAIAALVFGYQWYGEEGVVGAFAGPEGALSALADNEGTSFQTMRTGLRLQGEAWLRPSEDTLIQSTLVGGSTRKSLWARLAGGLRAFEAYIGPEIALYTEASGYRTWSLGLHATDFALAGLQVRLSAGGRVSVRERRAGPYVGLAVWRDW